MRARAEKCQQVAEKVGWLAGFVAQALLPVLNLLPLGSRAQPGVAVPRDFFRNPLGRKVQTVGVVVNAKVMSVFCSRLWALAEPVAGLALAERLTVRTRRLFACAMRSSRGNT